MANLNTSYKINNPYDNFLIEMLCTNKVIGSKINENTISQNELIPF